MGHWIFHKFEWEIISRAPVIYIGMFQDRVLERRELMGTCKCGAFKSKKEDVDTLLEAQIESQKRLLEYLTTK